jgi:hypothetical protein
MRTRSKRGGGNSGKKLRDVTGKVLRDRYGRAQFAGAEPKLPRNYDRMVYRIKARKVYLQAMAEQRAKSATSNSSPAT